MRLFSSHLHNGTSSLRAITFILLFHISTLALSQADTGNGGSPDDSYTGTDNYSYDAADDASYDATSAVSLSPTDGPDVPGSFKHPGGHDHHHEQVEISELQLVNITQGDCDRKTRTGDTISVVYTGQLQDGQVFDSNKDNGREPFTFELGGGHVIQGWELGMLDMCEGDERNLTIPSRMAYGGSGMGMIPPNAALFFETKLISIDEYGPDPDPNDTSAAEPDPYDGSYGASYDDADSSYSSSSVSSANAPDATAPPTTAAAGNNNADQQFSKTAFPNAGATEAAFNPDTTKLPNPQGVPSDTSLDEKPNDQAYDSVVDVMAETGECRLLGPFALFVQAGLGVLALMSLVWKRYREKPRRPVRVWFFDVSKQVVGTVLLHIANIGISTFFSSHVNITSVATHRIQTEEGHSPNPCSFYLINIFVDTTIGILFLYIALKVLNELAKFTPLARPPESIRTGHYGHPPKATWWIKQCLIYFIGLFFMKLCVYFLFEMLPWIAWVGDWALRWTEGSETLQVAFVMFLFPLVMNAIQYYVIDSFIKDPSGGEHEPISTEDQVDDESREPLAGTGRYDEPDSLRESTSEDGKEPLDARYREVPSKDV